MLPPFAVAPPLDIKSLLEIAPQADDNEIALIATRITIRMTISLLDWRPRSCRSGRCPSAYKHSRPSTGCRWLPGYACKFLLSTYPSCRDCRHCNSEGNRRLLRWFLRLLWSHLWLWPLPYLRRRSLLCHPC